MRSLCTSMRSGGVVVAEDRVHELVDEGVGLEIEAGQGTTFCRSAAPGISALCEPRRQARAIPGAFAMPPTPAGWFIVRWLSVMANCPEEERRPWLGGDPVQVASPGVQIGDLRGLGSSDSDLREVVLDLERTQRLVLTQCDGSPSRPRYLFIHSTTAMPKIVSSVLPTAYGIP